MSNIGRQVRLCLEVPLRDFATFEDLANDLGVTITEVTIVDTIDIDPRQKRARPKLKFKITPESWNEVMEYPESMTYSAISRQMRKLHTNEISKVPSAQTVSNIRRGVIKRPEEGE